MLRTFIIIASLLLLAAPGLAAPYLPKDEAQVLERLPNRSGPEYRDLKRLQASAAAAPGDVGAATTLADAYYRISRREGDPRYLGYAQAALSPWWKDADAPTAVLVTRATIRQSNHEFLSALADLDKAITREPDNARAILVRATVLTVQGKYDAARTDCGRLRGLTQDLYVLACIASIEALTGNTKQARAALLYALDNMVGSEPDSRVWIESLLGEIMQRQGDLGAELHFRAALAADPRDLYTLGAYSDWLLEQQRPADVIALVEKDQRVDPLLLRLALAQKAVGLKEADATISLLRARFDASRARGDTVHRREEARFQLMLENHATTALRLALENWQVQREPADLRILAEAAKAAGDAPAKDTVRRWLAETQLDYPAVVELVK